MEEQDKLARFEQGIMPHMNAAYNLGRWLAGNDSGAQDVVQEAYLRAFKFLNGFRGGDSRSWLLRIVRNVLHWSQDGMEFWAVSDMNQADLENFAQLLRNGTSPPSPP